MKRDNKEKPSAAGKAVRIIGKRNIMSQLKEHLKNRPDCIIITDLDPIPNTDKLK